MATLGHVALGLLVAATALALATAAFSAYRMSRFGRWYRDRTEAGAYYRLPLAARRAFADEVRRRGRFLVRTVSLVARVRPPRGLPHFRYRGVAGPALASSPKHFDRAFHYRPDAGDVFVATQMKCGTTWMQQLVYEVLMQGRGDLSDEGHGHLYAVSPWIESRYSIPMDEAPRLGPHRQRIVKTHLPAPLCPSSPAAKTVYVLRHPVACFGSCVDFVHMLAGAAAPDRAGLLEWFCSDRMWWGPWPDHAEGWWRRAQEEPNVLFLHYETMLADPGVAVDRLSEFLDVPLSDDERHAVLAKSSFDFMKSHEHWFEMSPPTAFSVHDGRSFFESGRRDRERGGDEAERDRILRFCRERLRGGRYPAGRFYPDLAR